MDDSNDAERIVGGAWVRSKGESRWHEAQRKECTKARGVPHRLGRVPSVVSNAPVEHTDYAGGIERVVRLK